MDEEEEERLQAVDDFFAKFAYKPDAFQLTILEDKWKASPKSMPSSRTVPVPSAPVGSKKQYINKRLRNAVWTRYMGEVYRGRCYCCNRKDIDVFSYQCGHVLAEFKGGEATLRNLRPICALCNTSCSIRHMRDFAMASGFTDSKICLEERSLPDSSSRNSKHLDK